MAPFKAYIQDTTSAILLSLAVPPGHQGHALFSLIRAATRTALGRFNTPNARNTLFLLNNSMHIVEGIFGLLSEQRGNAVYPPEVFGGDSPKFVADTPTANRRD